MIAHVLGFLYYFTIYPQRYEGQVIWFSPVKGFGFIRPKDASEDKSNSVFVHQTSIQTEGFRSLGLNEKVEYSLESDEQGRVKAVNVTGPQGDAVVGSRRIRRSGPANTNNNNASADGGSPSSPTTADGADAPSTTTSTGANNNNNGRRNNTNNNNGGRRRGGARAPRNQEASADDASASSTAASGAASDATGSSPTSDEGSNPRRGGRGGRGGRGRGGRGGRGGPRNNNAAGANNGTGDSSSKASPTVNATVAAESAPITAGAN